MEKKPTKKRKNALRTLLFVVGALALLLLSMAVTIGIQQCMRPQKPVVTTEAPTETPEPTPLPDRSYDSRKKPSFMPELDKLGLSDDELASYGEEYFMPENWLDITPDDLKNAVGCTVIRHIGLGYSYIVQEGAYYRLGEGDDGKGVLDVLLSDLNDDGEPDVLYTYHFGTGYDAQTKIGWFDFATLSGKLSPFGMQRDFLALNAEDGAYCVYRCTRFVDEEGGFALHFTDRIGEVVEQSGELYLMLE